MDVDTLAWFVDNSKRDIAQWKEMLHARGVGYLELTYEEITDAAFRFGRVWDFLQVKDIGAPASDTRKLIKSYDHITNLEEIQEALASEENGFL